MENNVESMDGDDDNKEDPLGFHIQDTYGNVHMKKIWNMKKIPPYFLPKFHGLRSENLKTFLFEFEIVCRFDGYLLKTQKMRLFLETLKDKALKWFMSLGTNSMRSWNDMQKIFLEKYKIVILKKKYLE